VAAARRVSCRKRVSDWWTDSAEFLAVPRVPMAVLLVPMVVLLVR
jgi:hypothetical protein